MKWNHRFKKNYPDLHALFHRLVRPGTAWLTAMHGELHINVEFALLYNVKFSRFNLLVTVKSNLFQYKGTINGKINGTPKGVYMPILKLHSVLAITNLLSYNNINIDITYYVRVNSLRLKWNVASKWASYLTTFGGTIYFAVDCTMAICDLFWFHN